MMFLAVCEENPFGYVAVNAFIYRVKISKT